MVGMVGTVIAAVIGFFALMIVMVVLGGVLTTWGWNTVIPQVFKLPSIDIIQGIALNVIGWGIFKSYTYSSK